MLHIVPIINIMLHKYNYLKILTNKQVKYFVAINFIEHFKSKREKVAKSLYIFLTTADGVEIYAKITRSNSCDNYVHHNNTEILNLFNPEPQPIKAKSMVKNKLKELLSELKKFKV